jgi:hypothetical protein
LAKAADVWVRLGWASHSLSRTGLARAPILVPKRSCVRPQTAIRSCWPPPPSAINATLYDKLNFVFLRDIAPVAGGRPGPGRTVRRAACAGADCAGRGRARLDLRQAGEFYRQFSSLIRAAKSDGIATRSLFGLSFLNGIFHAAGPGHGKAVISSYMVANEETWARGVVLSFASALFQALVAVALVGVAAVLLNATAATMGARSMLSKS